MGGYDGIFNPPGEGHAIPNQERGLAFFDVVLKEGATAFDVFDLRLYADPNTIPARVGYIRQKMVDLGYEKPIICTEYNGPGFLGFRENFAHLGMLFQWMGAIAQENEAKRSEQGKQTRAAIAALYAKMEQLPPQTQMFMAGCSKELEEKRHRINCRDLVMRNVLALSAGVQKTMYWDLWHDTSQRDDLMHLMYAKHKLLDYENGVLQKKYPAADAYRRMTEALGGVERVTRIEVTGRPSINLFEVLRRQRGPIYVVWETRDAFTGEDKPPASFEWKWDAAGAKAVDALGQIVPAKLREGRLNMDVSFTPIFIEPTRQAESR